MLSCVAYLMLELSCGSVWISIFKDSVLCSSQDCTLLFFLQGERLSHAVGCAFTACLQRKQKAQALQQQHKEVGCSG